MSKPVNLPQAKMKIEFSEHSKQRLKARKISQKEAKEVINKPDKVLKSYKNRQLFQKNLGDKILEVIAITENKKIIIITAYYLIK